MKDLFSEEVELLDEFCLPFRYSAKVEEFVFGESVRVLLSGLAAFRVEFAAEELLDDVDALDTDLTISGCRCPAEIGLLSLLVFTALAWIMELEVPGCSEGPAILPISSVTELLHLGVSVSHEALLVWKKYCLLGDVPHLAELLPCC